MEMPETVVMSALLTVMMNYLTRRLAEPNSIGIREEVKYMANRIMAIAEAKPEDVHDVASAIADLSAARVQ